jgi:DNA polymerase II large subunit
MEAYFEKIEQDLNKAYRLAEEARKKGYDPEEKVDIPVARNMAERVIGLVSAAAPQIIGTGIRKRIEELEKKYGFLDWRVALVIAEEAAREKFCKFKDKKEAIEIGIRIGFAYITLGTVASPLEGFSELGFKQRRDGKEYFSLYFSGPVRSAGGTGASVCVIIADYVRKKLGYDVYDPTEQEIQRMVTEVYDYHERITNLQYLPSEEEIVFLVKNLAVQLDGSPSEKIEVSKHKDLARISTNRIRNGPCLVIGECLAQKAPKLWKQLSKWGAEFGLEHWGWLEEFLKIQKSVKAKKKVEAKKEKISPDYTYIKDLVAGRPVLTHPLRAGGFRLRYGRCRTSGYSSAAIHPLTMKVLKDYIAIGTQIKVERPGKAAVLSVCDNIEGPVVKLEDGRVLRIEDEKQFKEVSENITEILFLGDILFNYGDFFNRAHVLAPAGYCEEWWVQEFEKAIVDMFGGLDLDKAAEQLETTAEDIGVLLKNPIKVRVSSQAAIDISKKMNIPLHPYYTYHFGLISAEQLQKLAEWFGKARAERTGGKANKIVLPADKDGKRILEMIGVPHLFVNKEFVVIEKQEARIFDSLGFFSDRLGETIERGKEKPALEILNQISSVKLRDKSGIFIGARMGRPEKAKMRKLTGSPQVLFPVGEQGGKLRSFQAAIEKGEVKAEFPMYYCEHCEKETVLSVCEGCGKKTRRKYFCKECGLLLDKRKCPKHGDCEIFTEKKINIKDYFDKFLKKLDVVLPGLVKGVRGTSNKEHIPEHLVKGILRARHSIYVNKDGTTRYDMTEMGITHFKPKEIGTPIERLKELGYENDIKGRLLESAEQIVEIKPQDVILPSCPESPDEGADKVFFRVCQFVDELLVKLYGLEPFYNLKTEKDLIGHLILGLAPHTSAAILGRIIGFSKTQGYLAHPMLHAAHRRDLDGDEACVMMVMDALLNFSRQYLPAHKGSTQDAPFVLTSKLTPSEVDDMIFDVDVAWKYPLEFYEATLSYKNPWDIKIEKIGDRLGTEKQYCDMGFTHDTTNLNSGTRCSAYKTLPSMEEKLRGQMELAEKIRAVDTSDVATLVIEKHFIRDIKGNLRKFSIQQFRCVNCNAKYRRPPLVGKCIKCGGRIIFTIAEGSVIKYLEPSMSLAEKYNVPAYLKQSLELVKRRIEGVFGKEKERQEGLGRWFG